MPSISLAANGIIGKSRDEYKCNQVVNQVLFGIKDSGLMASDFLTWGVEAFMPAERVVVVGKDGKHVGIFIDSKHFVHSSVSRQEVIIADEKQLEYVFPKSKGVYVLRKAF